MQKAIWRLAGVGVAAILGVAVGTSPAQAITNGTPDGDLHPNVGTVVADWRPASPGPDITCSGTLIAADVFLTVAHCVEFLESGGFAVHVTFDPTYDEDAVSPAGLIAGTAVRHPLFGSGGQSDPHDIAVILLEKSPGIAPAELPTADLLDQRQAAGAMHDQTFTAVGYGRAHVDKTGGPHAWLERDGVRLYATQTFLSLQPSWLRLSMNPSLDSGGACAGDSGGPHFLGGVESDLVVSITVGGDRWCRATDDTYRLDTESARDFLAQFVALP